MKTRRATTMSIICWPNSLAAIRRALCRDDFIGRIARRIHLSRQRDRLADEAVGLILLPSSTTLAST